MNPLLCATHARPLAASSPRRHAPHAPPQAIARALGGGGGTARAVAQATAQAYTQQPEPVADVRAPPPRAAPPPAPPLLASPALCVCAHALAEPHTVLTATAAPKPHKRTQRRPPCPPTPQQTLATALSDVNDEPQQAQAAGLAVAEALAAGGSEAQAFSSALSQAVSKGGCGAVSNVLAREHARRARARRPHPVARSQRAPVDT